MPSQDAIGSTGTPVSTPTPVPTNSAPTTFIDEMLDTATPDLLSCISQEGDACMSTAIELGGACGGAVPEISCTAGMRSDGLKGAEAGPSHQI